eukprot:4133053-Prymnesium_polylepis.1
MRACPRRILGGFARLRECIAETSVAVLNAAERRNGWRWRAAQERRAPRRSSFVQPPRSFRSASSTTACAIDASATMYNLRNTPEDRADLARRQWPMADVVAKGGIRRLRVPR